MFKIRFQIKNTFADLFKFLQSEYMIYVYNKIGHLNITILLLCHASINM